MLCQQPHDRAFERIELALALGSFTWLIFINIDPFADRALIQLQRGSDLRSRQLLFITQMTDLMEGLVIDHEAPPSTARRRMSPTLKAWPLRCGHVAVEAGGSANT